MFSVLAASKSIMTKNLQQFSRRKNNSSTKTTIFSSFWDEKGITNKRNIVEAARRKSISPISSSLAAAAHHRYFHLRAALVPLILPYTSYHYSTVVGNATQCQKQQQHQHEQPTVVKNQERGNTSLLPRYLKLFKKFLRMFKRALKVSVTITPLLLFDPLHRLLSLLRRLGTTTNDPHQNGEEEWTVLDWWMKLCLWCVEHNGAATVKLMQWASSRPDMFGERFCEQFCQLQDNTTPHSWEHTKSVMTKAYGSDWEKEIQLHEILGSGCIGQVYKGTTIDGSGIKKSVAVKVIHPNVRELIDSDLELLRFFAHVLDNLPFNWGESFKWWNLQGTVEEFSQLLKVQLDFRKEAENLERFNANFKNDPHVVFPKLVKGFDAHPDVLVETFVEGMPVIKFVQEHADNKALLHKMCLIGIDTVCRMIFYHNFVHADLHPGNILVSLPNGVPKFILLDVGMITVFKDEDFDNLIDILASIVRRNGRMAAELMIQDSEKKMSSTQLNHETTVINRENFIAKIKHLTDCDRDMSFFENIGGYILYICDAAATHHVRLNEAFASTALAVKVNEGVALSLDPKCHVWETANPIIVRAEMRRRFTRMLHRISDEISSLTKYFEV